MGMNYYLREQLPCPTCGRGRETLHIGKGSAGWCFSLHVIPELGINDLPDWIARWSNRGSIITDESGRVLAPHEMYSVITNRSLDAPPAESGWYAANGAIPGPNNLARYQCDGRCIGHGAGTWDLVIGEFS